MKQLESKTFPKLLLYGILLLSLLNLSSCDLLDLEEASEENPNSSTDSGLPQGLPANESEFNALFHNESELTWSSQSFTIASIEGLQACRLDDQMIIRSDGSYEYDGGIDLCGAEDNQRIKTGTWEVNAELNQLTFRESDQSVYTAELKALVSDTIILSGSYLGFEVNGVYIVQ